MLSDQVEAKSNISEAVITGFSTELNMAKSDASESNKSKVGVAGSELSKPNTAGYTGRVSLKQIQSNLLPLVRIQPDQIHFTCLLIGFNIRK
jgi:hypothetical protein